MSLGLFDTEIQEPERPLYARNRVFAAIAGVCLIASGALVAARHSGPRPVVATQTQTVSDAPAASTPSTEQVVPQGEQTAAVAPTVASDPSPVASPAAAPKPTVAPKRVAPASKATARPEPKKTIAPGATACAGFQPSAAWTCQNGSWTPPVSATPPEPITPAPTVPTPSAEPAAPAPSAPERAAPAQPAPAAPGALPAPPSN